VKVEKDWVGVVATHTPSGKQWTYFKKNKPEVRTPFPAIPTPSLSAPAKNEFQQRLLEMQKSNDSPREQRENEKYVNFPQILRKKHHHLSRSTLSSGSTAASSGRSPFRCGRDPLPGFYKDSNENIAPRHEKRPLLAGAHLLLQKSGNNISSPQHCRGSTTTHEDMTKWYRAEYGGGASYSGRYAGNYVLKSSNARSSLSSFLRKDVYMTDTSYRDFLADKIRRTLSTKKNKKSRREYGGRGVEGDDASSPPEKARAPVDEVLKTGPPRDGHWACTDAVGGPPRFVVTKVEKEPPSLITVMMEHRIENEDDNCNELFFGEELKWIEVEKNYSGRIKKEYDDDFKLVSTSACEDEEKEIAEETRERPAGRMSMKDAVLDLKLLGSKVAGRANSHGFETVVEKALTTERLKSDTRARLAQLTMKLTDSINNTLRATLDPLTDKLTDQVKEAGLTELAVNAGVMAKCPEELLFLKIPGNSEMREIYTGIAEAFKEEARGTRREIHRGASTPMKRISTTQRRKTRKSLKLLTKMVHRDDPRVS